MLDDATLRTGDDRDDVVACAPFGPPTIHETIVRAPATTVWSTLLEGPALVGPLGRVREWAWTDGGDVRPGAEFTFETGRVHVTRWTGRVAALEPGRAIGLDLLFEIGGVYGPIFRWAERTLEAAGETEDVAIPEALAGGLSRLASRVDWSLEPSLGATNVALAIHLPDSVALSSHESPFGRAWARFLAAWQKHTLLRRMKRHVRSAFPE